MAAWALLGAAAGLVGYDLLNAAGLHWLAWLIIGLLGLFVIAGTIIVRKRS